MTSTPRSAIARTWRMDSRAFLKEEQLPARMAYPLAATGRPADQEELLRSRHDPACGRQWVWLFCSELRVRLQDRVVGSGRGGCGGVLAVGAIASTRRSRRWR